MLFLAFMSGLEAITDTLFLKLIQEWLVGLYKGIIKGHQSPKYEFQIPLGKRGIAQISYFYLWSDPSLYRGWIEADTTKLFMGVFSRL